MTSTGLGVGGTDLDNLSSVQLDYEVQMVFCSQNYIFEFDQTSLAGDRCSPHQSAEG
jgi:hypothetical protein